MAMGWDSGNGLSAAEREKLAKIDVGVKSNLNATSAPTKTDDLTKGYSVGSTWIYNGTTYTCTANITGAAVWISSSEEVYFDDWAALITAISVVGTNYINKYAHLANANGAPSSGLTYTAPGVLPDYIVDGGSAILEILAQGASYSVRCLTRTVTNPVVTAVMLIPAPKFTTKGYYIFSAIPTDGLPVGVGLNDIAYYDGSVWSIFQKYSVASAVLVAGTTTNTQVTWRKFNGRWMSTADDYIPDGKEYQTGKLWNGKAVYRRCKTGSISATGTNNIGVVIPMTGFVLLTLGTIKKSTTGSSLTVHPAIQFSVGSDGNMRYENSDTNNNSASFVAWVEYTKS
jgi:hypothetical protein